MNGMNGRGNGSAWVCLTFQLLLPLAATECALSRHFQFYSQLYSTFYQTFLSSFKFGVKNFWVKFPHTHEIPNIFHTQDKHLKKTLFSLTSILSRVNKKSKIYFSLSQFLDLNPCHDLRHSQP
jgi:uncharacterized membrane protein YoaK (UPF0700 family)